MDFLNNAFELIQYILKGLIVYGILILVEQLRPAEKNQPFTHILFNLQWFVVYILFGELIYMVGIETLADLIKSWFHGPYFILPLTNSLVGKISRILFYLLVVDFFYYWFHRLQHKNKFLWEEHKFHHSDVSLNVTSATRAHWLESPLALAFVFVPLGILFQIESEELGLIGFIDILWLQFTHLNLHLELGILKTVIVGPQYHRIHHSFAPAHIDKNFAAFFPIWDILFGTYCPGKKGEFPATGLTTHQKYNNIWVAITLPFREWFGMRYLESFKRKFAKRKL